MTKQKILLYLGAWGCVGALYGIVAQHLPEPAFAIVCPPTTATVKEQNETQFTFTPTDEAGTALVAANLTTMDYRVVTCAGDELVAWTAVTLTDPLVAVALGTAMVTSQPVLGGSVPTNVEVRFTWSAGAKSGRSDKWFALVNSGV